MTTQLDDDNYLTIRLLSYDKPTELTERFYFLEMSTLQATTLLPRDNIIVTAKIFAHTEDNAYLDEETVKNFKTIGDFNDFFVSNADYYLHNCNVELENGINIGSHDDGEVSVQFTRDDSGQLFIDNIFERYNLDKQLIEALKAKPGHYIAIDKHNNVTGDYKDFDDYI